SVAHDEKPGDTAVGTPSAPRASAVATYAAFAGCCAIWGSTFLVMSIGNDTVPPLWAAALRLALAALLLTAITRLKRQPLPRGAALRSAIGYGVFEFGFNFPLLYWSEKFVPSGLAAVFYATSPLTGALIARAYGLERLSAPKMAGAIVALIGV